MCVSIFRNLKVFLTSIVLFLGFNVLAQESGNPSPLVFPQPQGIKDQLFYLQRDPNINTIICQLNTGSDGEVVRMKPVLIYWIRYDENKGKKELNLVQRKFAYGIDTKEISRNLYELRFVSHKKFIMYLSRSNVNQKFYVYVTVNHKKIQLERIFLRVEGGSFWLPNVKYVEIEGKDMSNNSLVVERIII